MARLEDLKQGTLVKGVTPSGPVTVVSAQWHGPNVVELTYKDSSGNLGNQLMFRDREASLETIEATRVWSFDVEGGIFRLVSEAYRIRLAHLFDPVLAVHTSVVDPLPHQITAVYETMLPRQPLRFLLADDPGAGKTIMAGLFIKELAIRGDVRRCLICCPGNLVDQWQDEMWRRFGLDFKIISNQTIEDSKSGNPYNEANLVISRLDHMSRNESIQAKLRQTEWDLVIVDEAHKMSAHFFGSDIKETKRYKLGQLLGAPDRTRHLLLLTATPHNGKEEDFQLFMALLDSDRFEGKFRDGIHIADTSDVMRRLVKEQLVKFDGTPLFPERWAYTVTYELSNEENDLYNRVTAYVQEEMNRVDRLMAEGEGRRGNRVGFALTSLQRRLASSPAAIHESLRRRRERLEKRLNEERIMKHGLQTRIEDPKDLPILDEDDLDEMDDRPSGELESLEDKIVEQASASRNVAELEKEIETLKSLELLAATVRRSGKDKKWEQLSNLLQNNHEIVDVSGNIRKLIIFSEHRDTVDYLVEKIRGLVGRHEAVVTIHGSMGREDRRKTQEAFLQNKDVFVLVATDAAGEGINLQRAHLMVNYDLPWNPNRLEQRFGRIHRIGQEEVCHMWSLVAYKTREGEVYHRLLTKLEEERKALGGGVFDILGRVFEGDELRKLLLEAIRYGDQPEVRSRHNKVVDAELDRDHLRQLLEDRALAHDSLDTAKVQRIREDMERADARKLQPHFIRAFFLEAFAHFGGTAREREPKRYEVTHVPQVMRSRDRLLGVGEPLMAKYERVCFEKDQITIRGKPLAELVCPGHPLLDVVIDLMLEKYRNLLKEGAILVDPTDISDNPRLLFYLEHSLQDARTLPDGRKRIVSQQMQFVEVDRNGDTRAAGYAPYLDYRSIGPEERESILPILSDAWLKGDFESKIMQYAIERVVPRHLEEVRRRREEVVDHTVAAVKDRLTKEINYWDYRANELKMQELAGKVNAKINSGKARQRADELEARLKKRLDELELERHVYPVPPVIIGGALVVPEGLLQRLRGQKVGVGDEESRETKRIEQLAMRKVLEIERLLDRRPVDVSAEKVGYDIESGFRDSGRLLFIEVKGRDYRATTVTVTKNEILTGLNKPEEFILAVVLVDGKSVHEPVYIRYPFGREPDFGVTSVNYDLGEIIARGGKPQ
ncbi:MAG: helicase-related protein [Dehalococcoidales bacterium]